MENLSSRLNFFKKKLKLTNEKIATLANLPQATVERISSGRTTNPNLKTLKAIANVFNCTLDELLDLKDTKKPYYLDDNTAKIAHYIVESETFSTLFKTMLNLDYESQQAVVGLSLRLSNLQK